jgi:hypothetical protein
MVMELVNVDDDDDDDDGDDDDDKPTVRYSKVHQFCPV